MAQPLADFLGVPVISRSNIPKRISTYAKLHDLQDPADRRTVVCDDALKTALSVDRFTFFQLAKLISGLVYKADECGEELQKLAKECEVKAIEEKTKKKEEEAANGIQPKQRGSRKKQKTPTDPTKKRPSGLSKPMQLSAALIAVCGDEQLPRSEVMKRIWIYIRENGLKDSTQGSLIQCDQKLRAVFEGQPTVSPMGINKFLSAHMTKIV